MLDWLKHHSLVCLIWLQLLSGHFAVGPFDAGLQQFEFGDVQHVEIQNGDQGVLADLVKAGACTGLREPCGNPEFDIADKRIANLQFQELIVDHANVRYLNAILSDVISEILNQIRSEVPGKSDGRRMNDRLVNTANLARIIFKFQKLKLESSKMWNPLKVTYLLAAM